MTMTRRTHLLAAFTAWLAVSVVLSVDGHVVEAEFGFTVRAAS